MFNIATVLLTYINLGVLCFQVVEKEISHSDGVSLGGIVTMKCKSNELFDQCSWMHNGRICEYSFTGISYETKSNNCGGMSTEVSFTGSYEAHECSIEVTNVSADDDGIWTCDMMTFSQEMNALLEDKDYLSLTIIGDPTKAVSEETSDSPITTTWNGLTSHIMLVTTNPILATSESSKESQLSVLQPTQTTSSTTPQNEYGNNETTSSSFNTTNLVPQNSPSGETTEAYTSTIGEPPTTSIEYIITSDAVTAASTNSSIGETKKTTKNGTVQPVPTFGGPSSASIGGETTTVISTTGNNSIELSIMAEVSPYNIASLKERSKKGDAGVNKTVIVTTSLASIIICLATGLIIKRRRSRKYRVSSMQLEEKATTSTMSA